MSARVGVERDVRDAKYKKIQKQKTSRAPLAFLSGWCMMWSSPRNSGKILWYDSCFIVTGSELEAPKGVGKPKPRRRGSREAK